MRGGLQGNSIQFIKAKTYFGNLTPGIHLNTPGVAMLKSESKPIFAHYDQK